jgi:hypothetical protein
MLDPLTRLQFRPELNITDRDVSPATCYKVYGCDWRREMPVGLRVCMQVWRVRTSLI